ncbi:WD40 repeat-like protein [Gonapodya prolifera JEL478]|uniref:WD40 repeat-like protein n=1 Tax=Gonapodya prolifera (strain JEL478) TaxID=1344416 RepID=A0A139AZF4_GONPJ|nr:WD40 repeat-like protein [Gonapodya prolifera JEL478]|eukprot:KXS22116.1 WD40 repeat-like protein [Gonapodya prolifera JEL478]
MECLKALTELQQMGETLHIPFLEHFFRNFDPQTSKALAISMSHFGVRHLESADYRSAYHQLCDWFYGWNVTDAAEIVDIGGMRSSPKLRRIPREIDISLDVEKQECARISQTFETLFSVSRRGLNRMYIEIDEKIPVLGMGTLAKAKSRVGHSGQGGREAGSDEGLHRFDDKESVWADAAGMVAVEAAITTQVPGLPVLPSGTGLSPSPSMAVENHLQLTSHDDSASFQDDKRHTRLGRVASIQTRSQVRVRDSTKTKGPSVSTRSKKKGDFDRNEISALNSEGNVLVQPQAMNNSTSYHGGETAIQLASPSELEPNLRDVDNASVASSSSSLDESEQVDPGKRNEDSSNDSGDGETEDVDGKQNPPSADGAITGPMAAVLRAVMKDDMDETLRNLRSDIEVVYSDIDRSVDYTLICVGNILVVLAIAELLKDETTFRSYVGHAVEISTAFVSNTLKTTWDLLRREVPRESLTLADLREPLLLRSVVRKVAELRTPQATAEVPNPKLYKIPIRKIHRKVQLLHTLLTSVDVHLLPRFVLAHKNDCKAAAASRYGSSLWLTGGYDGVVRIHDLTARTTLAQYVGHKSVITDVHFARDDSHVVSCSFDRSIKIWNSQTAVCERTLQGHTDSVTSCDVSPDGRFIATGSLDCTVKLWDYNTGECLCTVKKHTRWIKVVRFTPDGRYFASAGLDRRVFFWDVKLMANTQGNVTQSRVIDAHGDYVLDLAMAKPSYVVTCSRDMTIKVFDYVTGQELHTNSLAPSWACTVAFSPDGEFFVTGSFDNNLVIFRTKTGERVRSFRVFNLGVSVVRFAKGMGSLVCGTGEGYLQEIPL